MPPVSEILPAALPALDNLVTLLTLALHTAKALGALYTTSRDLYLFFTTAQQWTGWYYIVYQFKYNMLLLLTTRFSVLSDCTMPPPLPLPRSIESNLPLYLNPYLLA